MVGQRTPEDMLPNESALDTVGSQAGSDDSGPQPGSEDSSLPSLADADEWEDGADVWRQVDVDHGPHNRGAGRYNELPSHEELQAAAAVEDARGYYAALAARIGNNAGDDNTVEAEEEVGLTGEREVDIDPEAIATLSAAIERAGWRPGQPLAADGGHRTYAVAHAPPLEPQLQALLDANHRLREYFHARWEYFQDRERAREEGHHLLHIDGADQSDFVLPWVQRPPGRNPPE